MKAIRVDVDFATGLRAGGEAMRTTPMTGHPSWQDLEVGFEIRMLKSEKDAVKFKGLPGVTVLKDEAAIDAAVACIGADVRPTFAVWSDGLFAHSLQDLQIDVSALSDDCDAHDPQAVLAHLKAAGVLGIAESKAGKPVKACQIHAASLGGAL